MLAESIALRPLVQEELTRLATCETLRRAPMHMRLLRYLVEKELAGEPSALCEISIALDVFRRDPTTYDPQIDPIVRVATGRLRARLDACYARPDAPRKVRIMLRRGRYAPDFVVESGKAATPHGLAVLRTLNATGQPHYHAFCLAFAERLSNSLAHAGIARVIARSSVDHSEASSQESSNIGARLNAAWLLESTLSREGKDQFCLSVRLIRASDAGVRWVKTGSSTIAGLYPLSDRMSDIAVLRTCAVLPHTATGARNSIAGSPLSSEERAALDTVQLLLLQRTLAAADEAVALSDGVVATCPGASEAWAALAAAWYSRLTFMDREIGPLAECVKQTADRALALDADDPVALRTKAIIIGKYDYDVARAEALFTRALRAMPHYTSARLNYSEVLLLQGRFDEALTEIDLALLYDPLSVSVRLARGLCLQYQGRFDESRREWALFRASGEKSFWAFTGSGLNELAAGNLDAAEKLFDAAVARFPDLRKALMCQAYLYATRGEADRARTQERACLERFPHYSRTDRAVLAALLRDKASTIAHLTAAQSEHDMQFLYASIEPAFAWLAADAAFLRVLRRSHVPGWRGRRRS